MAKPNTIFNRLDRIFKPDGKKTVSRATNINSYSIDNKEIIRTTDKGEYEKAKLQAQQAKFLSSQWRKVDNETYQQAIHYETTRIGSYTDFENMEFYPEISAALDIMMEEASTLNEDGKILSVYSESDRVKRILQDLFFNRLDLHTNLPMWIRNVCKYGDNFIYLKMEDDMGIVGATQLRNFEIERRENDLFNGHYVGDNSDTPDGDKDSHQTRFFWKGKDIMFKSWQVGHFRLLGDDRKLPYGTCLKGDTRVNTEFGVEEISKIEIGTKVWSFDTNTQEKVLSPILDKINSGTKECFKISTRHNFIDASKEHKILVATEGGEFIYKNVNDLQLGDLLVLNKNEYTNNKIKIDKSLPNGNKNGWFNNVHLIPDYVTEEFAQLFGFLIGDGWVTSNNSQVVFALGVDTETNKYYYNLLEKFSGKEVIFTKNEQVHVNSKLLKTILERMGFGGKSYEKRIPNWVFEMERDFQKAFVSGLMDADGWATRDQWVIGLHIELNNKPLIEDLKILLQRIGYKSGSIRSRIRKTPVIEGREIKNVRESHLITFFDSYLKQMQKYEFKNRKTDNFILEPIQSIESIGEFETYDIYVENDNHNFYANNIVVHNSVLEKARRIWKQLLLSEDAMLIYRVTRAPERRVYKVYVGNIDDEDVEPYMNDIANRFKRTPLIDSQTGQIDLRYNQMAYDQDFFIPVREEGAQNPIDTLPGASNLDQIADIEYLQRKLFTALRVPKSFLGFEEAQGEGKNLAMQDIRFTRTINRIQQSIIMELNKIAIIHLYLLGLEDELDNFKLTMQNPSTQAEMLKIEHLQQKLTAYRDAVSDAGNGFGAMSMTKAKNKILGMSNDEIKQDLLEQRMEMAASAELAKTESVIKHTGFFDKVDKIYGDMEVAMEGGSDGEEGGDSDSGSGGGGSSFGGGGPISDEDLDFGDEESELDDENFEDVGDISDEESDFGDVDTEPVDTDSTESNEQFNKTFNILTENHKKIAKKIAKKKVGYRDNYMDKLVKSYNKVNEKPSIVRIEDKTLKVNESINNMINSIDDLLET